MPPAATASFLSIHLEKAKRKKKNEKFLFSSILSPILFESSLLGFCPYPSAETALLKVTTDHHIAKSNHHFSGSASKICPEPALLTTATCYHAEPRHSGLFCPLFLSLAPPSIYSLQNSQHDPVTTGQVKSVLCSESSCAYLPQRKPRSQY